MPVPMMNIINGGAHADNSCRYSGIHDIAGWRTQLRRGTTIRRRNISFAEKRVLQGMGSEYRCRRRRRFCTGPAIERRGTRHDCRGDRACRFQAAGSDDILLGTRCRQFGILCRRPLSHWTRKAGISMPPDFATIWPTWSMPTRSLRSKMAWMRVTGRAGQQLTASLGDPGAARRRRPVRHQHAKSWRAGIEQNIANSVLIKPNQIGTLTETLDAITMAVEADLLSGNLAPVGGDLGQHDCRYFGRDSGHADQDRLIVTI